MAKVAGWNFGAISVHVEVTTLLRRHWKSTLRKHRIFPDPELEMQANSTANVPKTFNEAKPNMTEYYELMYLQNRLKHMLPTVKFTLRTSAVGSLLEAELIGKYRVLLAPLRYKKTISVPIVILPDLSRVNESEIKSRFSIEIITENLRDQANNDVLDVNPSNNSRLRRTLLLVSLEDVVTNTLILLEKLRKDALSSNSNCEVAA